MWIQIARTEGKSDFDVLDDELLELDTMIDKLRRQVALMRESIELKAVYTELQGLTKALQQEVIENGRLNKLLLEKGFYEDGSPVIKSDSPDQDKPFLGHYPDGQPVELP